MIVYVQSLKFEPFGIVECTLKACKYLHVYQQTTKIELNNY